MTDLQAAAVVFCSALAVLGLLIALARIADHLGGIRHQLSEYNRRRSEEVGAQRLAELQARRTDD